MYVISVEGSQKNDSKYIKTLCQQEGSWKSKSML